MILKKSIVSILFLSILLLLTACGDKAGVQEIGFSDLNEILEKEGAANVVVYYDDDSKYMKDIETVAAEQETSIKVYKPTESDEKYPDGSPAYPSDLELKYNTLYQLKDGKVKKEMPLDYYLGAERREQIKKTIQ